MLYTVDRRKSKLWKWKFKKHGIWRPLVYTVRKDRLLPWNSMCTLRKNVIKTPKGMGSKWRPNSPALWDLTLVMLLNNRVVEGIFSSGKWTIKNVYNLAVNKYRIWTIYLWTNCFGRINQNLEFLLEINIRFDGKKVCKKPNLLYSGNITKREWIS